MPLPRAIDDVTQEMDTIAAGLGDVQTALDALPATPLEADLPDIVAVVASLKSITDSLLTQTQAFISIVSTTRINS